MKAADVMTRMVTTVSPTDTVAEAVRRMLDGHISGLPVVDAKGHLVGVVTEGDLLRRIETGTVRHRSGWLAFLKDTGSLAKEYLQSHGRAVSEVMSTDLATVTRSTSLEEVVALMEKRRIKRVLVTHDQTLVGVVSRADLLRAFASRLPAAPAADQNDQQIHRAMMRELKKEEWAPHFAISVAVKGGVVTLHGGLFDLSQRDAVRVMAENLPGVKSVRDEMFWIEPIGAGMM